MVASKHELFSSFQVVNLDRITMVNLNRNQVVSLNRMEVVNFTGFCTYSSKHQPWGLIATFEAGETRSEALSLERFIKKQKSRKLIEQLLDVAFIPNGKLAQLVKSPALAGLIRGSQSRKPYKFIQYFDNLILIE